MLDPVAGTVRTILDPVADAVGAILDPVAGTVGTILDPVTDTVGAILDPVRGDDPHDPRPGHGHRRRECSTRSRGRRHVLGPVTAPSARSSTRSPARSGRSSTRWDGRHDPRPVRGAGRRRARAGDGRGTVLTASASAIGTVIHRGAGTDEPVAGPSSPRRRRAWARLADEMAAGSAPSAAASATAPSPIAAAAARGGDHHRPHRPHRRHEQRACWLSGSSRAPPTRFASEAFGANQPTLRELTPLLDPSLSATPRTARQRPWRAFYVPSRAVPPAGSGGQGSPAGGGAGAGASPGLHLSTSTVLRGPSWLATRSPRPLGGRWRSSALLERPG